MRTRTLLLAAFALLGLLSVTAQRSGVEAFEVGRDTTDRMPKGKEADGLPGDFVLRNDKVELLIGGNLPLRRANMTTEYGSPIPGTIFDLDLRDGRNDQLTAFRPGDERGMMTWVKLVDAPGAGAAAVEAVRTAPSGDGLYSRHEYRLETGWQYVLVTSTYRNEGKAARKITPPAAWKGLDQEARAGEVRTGDSIDSFDKRGYAWAPIEPRTVPDDLMLQPGESKTYKIAFAVAESPLAAYGVVAGLLGDAGLVTGRIADPDGKPAVRAALVATISGTALKGYPDADGKYSIALPAGSQTLKIEDIGRDAVQQSVQVAKNKTATLDWKVGKAALVRGTVRDSSGAASPAKVQWLGRNGTPTPNFGTEYRVHGNSHQYQTHDGSFEQQVPPGDYLVRITHGPEFDLYEQEITVGKGETVEINATLKRSVDTAGWVSTDFHAHSTPSGDNYTRTDDRIINFAAEHIEFAPTTEHNRIYDWAPHIDRLGLSARLKTVPGIELTGSGQHFNAFPLSPDPLTQNGGAPVWTFDPRINAIVLRDWGTPSLHGGTRYDSGANARNARDVRFGGGSDRWVQANHPVVQNVFFDRDEDGVRDGGFVGFEKLIDAAEVWSAEILHHEPMVERRGQKWPNRTFFWLQMLNQGRHVWCVSVSDAHRIFGNGVGDWRTYVPSSTDEPGEIDHAEIVRNAKAGQMMVTNGPFLQVQTVNGMPIGSTIHAEGYVDLKIKVQAANWIDVDRVQVLVNGRMPESLNFTARTHPEMFRSGVVRFEQTVRVPLQEDAHLIVAAVSEDSDLSKGWGLNPQGSEHPTAYTNPIYVDTGHDGFQASGDTLDHELPSSKLGED
ncbi:MAG: hypothetical protein GC160_18195 [Acidobacteria bacterium]|nr:hypothetical protein [Acidobacteriota bacterium]